MADAVPMRSAHAHMDLEINYVFSGRLRYRHGGRALTLCQGSWVAFSAALPHRTRALRRETAFMWLSVPLTLLLRWGLDPSLLTRLLAGGVWVDDEERVQDGARARSWVAGLAQDDAWQRAIVDREVQARLRRLADRCAGREPDPAGGAQARVRAICQFLIEHFHEDIGLADVAARVDLHPNHALTIFRRTCGITIWQFVKRLRLAQAQGGLLRSDLPIAAVARQSGFATLSSFYQAFRDEFQMTPAAFRRAPCALPTLAL